MAISALFGVTMSRLARDIRWSWLGSFLIAPRNAKSSIKNCNILLYVSCIPTLIYWRLKLDDYSLSVWDWSNDDTHWCLIGSQFFIKYSDTTENFVSTSCGTFLLYSSLGFEWKIFFIISRNRHISAEVIPIFSAVISLRKDRKL